MHRTAAMEGFAIPQEAQLTLLEASCDWAFVTDESFRICFCHKCHSDRFEIMPQSLLGCPFQDFIAEPCRAEVMAVLYPENILRKVGVETIYLDPMMGLQLLKVVPMEEAGVLQGYSITQRHISEENLRYMQSATSGGQPAIEESQAMRQQRLIAQLSADFSKEDDIDRLFSMVVRELGSFLKVDRCSIFRHHAQEKTYGVQYEWCAPGIPSTKAFLQNIPYNDEDEGFKQLTTRPYLAVDDTFAFTGEMYKIQRDSGVHAFVDLPINLGGEFWGFLGADYGGGPHYWTQSEFHMLQTIGGIMAAKLEKREVENRLYDAFEKLGEIVRSYPGIIWALGPQNEVTLFEGQAAKSMGVDRENLLGVNLLEEADSLGLTSLMGCDATQGAQNFDVEIGGRHFTCQTVPMRDQTGNSNGMLGVALDSTESHEMQNRLHEAVEAAEAANQAKTDFLSRMSHEIRTPMNAIIGMNEIAKKTDEPERLRYCLEKIEEASRQLLGLINDILDLSKIESGKMELLAEEFDFEQMLQKVYQILQPRIEEKRQEFSFDMETMYQRAMIGDELRLNQVITNLLTNAVKFTPEGGKINLKTRILEPRTAAARLRVEVRDTGIGIAREEQEKLFRSFEQADGSITRRFGGTGLGLAICKRIVELMEGEIWVESVLGEGSSFIFEVPVRLGSVMEKGRKRLPDVRDVRILTVDDAEETLEYAQQILRGFHMHCDVASSGRAALELVRKATQAETPYDIIFIDWKMPDMDGIETAHAVQELAPKETIVIMISVADWTDLREEAHSIGVTHFMPKPLLPSTLLETIVDLLGRPEEEELRQGQPDEDYHWEGRRVLLAEDIAINREIVCSLLEPTGIEIDCVGNGREALAAYLDDPVRFDLILMDVQMPEMDGYEATRKIRASGLPNALNIPILAMTANAFHEDVENSLTAGMNNHIAKPIDVDELMEKLNIYLPPLKL